MLQRKYRVTAMVAMVACTALAIGPPAWSDRGQAVIKKVPQARETLVIAPESVDRSASRESGSRARELVRFEFHRGYVLEQSLPLSRDAGTGMVVTLVDPAGFRRSWTLSPTFEDDISRAFTKLTSTDGTEEIRAAAVRGETMYEVLGQILERSLDPGDLDAVMALGQAMKPIDRQAISRSIDATIRPLLESGLARDVLLGGQEHSECPGAIGVGATMAGSALLCWASTSIDAALHGPACVALTTGLGSSVMNIMTRCGGGLWDGCSCWPIKNCSCCSVAIGEECLCDDCGASDPDPCCDWEPAADEGRVGPGIKGGGR